MDYYQIRTALYILLFISIFGDCDEIWHAGDIGSLDVVYELKQFKPLKGVYGNIDGFDIRGEFQKINRFFCEDVDVLITHIGGYPGNYEPSIRQILSIKPPQLFISGHSHILKIMHDPRFDMLHMNPGAAGISGFHKVITFLKFEIEKNDIKNVSVIELPRSASL